MVLIFHSLSDLTLVKLERSSKSLIFSGAMQGSGHYSSIFNNGMLNFISGLRFTPNEYSREGATLRLQPLIRNWSNLEHGETY